MNDRPPRLGGIVDDYCPRERRITDHAVVAMVEDDIKRTRCTTCDEEHPYKRAKVPALRKKKATLYEEVLASKGDANASAPPSLPAPGASAGSGQALGVLTGGGGASPAPETAPLDASAEVNLPELADEVRVHRTLIRATLPRAEGQVQSRPLPEFTVRQSGSFEGQYRDGAPRHTQRGPGASGNGSSDRQPGQHKPPGQPGQPGHRRREGSKLHRPHRGPGGRPQSASGNEVEPPGGRPRSRSRRSRHSSRNKKREK